MMARPYQESDCEACFMLGKARGQGSSPGALTGHGDR